MDNPLDPVAVRVLGSLIEKEITTPDNYPLTLNALTTACNQVSNREPVMSLDEATVLDSVDDLARRGLARAVHRGDARTKRYRQTLSESLNLHAQETAVLCVLLLRGPQTVGEIRTRTARLFEFIDLSHVELTLQSLMTLPRPLVAQLPRRPGQKDVRYAHLLAGEPHVDDDVPSPAGAGAGYGSHGEATAAGTDAASAGAGASATARIEALEQEVSALRGELAELRRRFEEFQQQFQ